MAEKPIVLERLKAKREFDGKGYILTKINYTEEDGKTDEAWHNGQGRGTKLVEEDGYWLLYTKIGI